MTNNNIISRVVLLLILFFLENFGSIKCRDSEGHSLKNTCDAPVVTEGDTGVMTFFLRDTIDLDSDRVFISLKRAQKPAAEEVLAECRMTSPLKCESQNRHYEISDRIANHQLTLQIQNITKAFEDTYVLHVFVKDVPEPSDICYLIVQEKNSKGSCSSPTVKEGDTGVMRFFFHQDVNSSSNHLTAKLAKDGDRVREIMSCHRKEGQSNFKCDVKDKLFTVDGAVQHSLTMRIPSITQNLQGHYILEVMGNKRHLHHETCYLKVEDVPADTKEGNTIIDHVEICIVIAVVLVIITICLGIIVFRQASCRQQNKPDWPDEASLPLLPFNGAEQRNAEQIINAHENKRWFFTYMSDEEENRFLKSKRNSPGSFLVKVSPTNPGNYILAVFLERGIQYLTIIPEERRLLCPITGKYCHTLCEFVNYYREHDIIVKNRVWGKLSTPFEQEPDAEWYFGKLADDQAKQILQKNGSGSFLVMVSYLDDDSYDLAVNYRDTVLFFGIVPEDDGFMMLDTHNMFESVNDIVYFFTHNDLKVDEQHDYGKLCKPCNRDSEDNA